MIYEVINPSDPITIEANDRVIAQAAALFLGRGKYGLTDEEGKEALPLFLFGMGFDEWVEETKFNLDAIMKDRWTEVADCLETAVVADLSERKAILAAVGPHGKDAVARFNEEKRSSLNDISGYAFKIAKGIREKYGKSSEQG